MYTLFPIHRWENVNFIVLFHPQTLPSLVVVHRSYQHRSPFDATILIKFVWPMKNERSWYVMRHVNIYCATSVLWSAVVKSAGVLLHNISNNGSFRAIQTLSIFNSNSVHFILAHFAPTPMTTNCYLHSQRIYCCRPVSSDGKRNR